MTLGLTMGLKTEQRLAMDVSGGCYGTIFPRVERMLVREGYRRDLDFVTHNIAGKKRHYQSLIDFFFCELYPDFRIACKRYYREDGPPLKEQLLFCETHTIAEGQMILALKLARKCRRRGTAIDWNEFVRHVEATIVRMLQQDRIDELL